MRHLKKYKLFESKSLEDIDWNLPYEETWPIVREIINRASLKIRKRELVTQPPSHDLEWIGTGDNAKLCLRKDFYQKWVLSFQKAEEFYDDFIDFIIDMNDTISDGEVKFSNDSVDSSKWKVSWDVRNYLNDPSQYDKIKGHDLLELSKLINLLNHAFDVTGVKKEDIDWKIWSESSGRGYANYRIIVNFCVR